MLKIKLFNAAIMATLMLFSVKSFSVEISEDEAILYKYYEAIAKAHILNDRINEQFNKSMPNYNNDNSFRIIDRGNGYSTIYQGNGHIMSCKPTHNGTYCW